MASRLLDALPFENEQSLEEGASQSRASSVKQVRQDPNAPDAPPSSKKISIAAVVDQHFRVNVLSDAQSETARYANIDAPSPSSFISPSRVYRKIEKGKVNSADGSEHLRKPYQSQADNMIVDGVIPNGEGQSKSQTDATFREDCVVSAITKCVPLAEHKNDELLGEERVVAFQKELHAIFQMQSADQARSLANLHESVSRICARHLSSPHGFAASSKKAVPESGLSRLGVPVNNADTPALFAKLNGQDARLPHYISSLHPNEYDVLREDSSTPRTDACVRETSFVTTATRRSTCLDVLSKKRIISGSGHLVDGRQSLLERFLPGFGRFKRWAHSQMLVEGDGVEPLFAGTIKSMQFKLCGILLIIVNFFFMIYEVDWNMGHLHEEEAAIFLVANISFTVLYSVELFCNIYAYRLEFFFGSEVVWHAFDVFVVIVSVIDLFFDVFAKNLTNSSGMAFLKGLRFFRMSRLLKMFHAMRMFKELRLMIDMFVNSMCFFCWCLLLLGMFLSLFAIFIVQGLPTFLQSLDASSPDSQKLQKDIQDNFGTVQKTMLSLFMSCTGGNDWIEYHQLLEPTGTVHIGMFLCFLLYSTVAFFNVIGGVFCQKAMALAAPTMKERVATKRKKDAKDAADLLELLRDLLKNRTHVKQHTLNLEDFDDFLEHPEALLYFEMRGMSETSVRRFFELLLHTSGRDQIDVGKFVSSVIKLDGNASNLDLHVLYAELQHFQWEMQEHLEMLHLQK